MTREMTATEIKARLLGVLDEVEAGAEVRITRRGRPVARLLPARGPRRLRGRFAGAAMSDADDDALFSTGATWDLP
jgi:prevent-host-death family protein